MVVPASRAGAASSIFNRQQGVAMNMMSSVARIAPPTHSRTDFAYETECKEVLASQLAALLQEAEAAGWDRRKAAYTIMYLAARQLSDKKEELS